MATSTQQRVEQQLDQLTKLQPDQARTKITTFPAEVVYEARYALQVLKEHAQGEPQLLDVIEPLAMAIGWVEASAFFMDTSREREALKSLNPQFSS